MGKMGRSWIPAGESLLFLLALALSSSVVLGQTEVAQTTSTTGSSPSSSSSPGLNNETTIVSSSPNPTTLSVSSSSNPTTISTNAAPAAASSSSSDGGQSLYDVCAAKNGTICYGDKSNCIKLRTCTFVGAISENADFINVTVLTRTYNPPYDGVNLTVELSREKKGNESVIQCSRLRFKNFKIRLSWKNKTTYEVPDQPGNETQLAQTIIDKTQLRQECLDDQMKSNFTSPPSQNLALKFYIMNNNRLVSQGLTHIDVQESKSKAENATGNNTNRESYGRALKDDAAAPTKSAEEEKEDSLYEMCVKNTALCFGDKQGCTTGHNCTVLGVIKENRTNYVVYLVTKSSNPPLNDLNVTLTLGATYLAGGAANSSSTDNSTTTPQQHMMKDDGCHKPDFKDLQVQSIWRTSDPLQLTNETVIRETALDKMTIQARCNSDVRLHLMNSTENLYNETMEESINYYLHFHLENGTLVPGEVSSDFEFDPMDAQNVTTLFEIGQNGTARLIGENLGKVSSGDESSSGSNSPSGNSAAHINYLSVFVLSLSAVLTTVIHLF